MNNTELYHYGIKGMKWGERHDRKTADRLGVTATRDRHVQELSKKTLEKSSYKYAKKPTEKNKSRMELDAKIYEKSKAKAKNSLSELKKHHSEMMKKYGSEKVKDIKYDKNGNVDDWNRGKYYASKFASVFAAVSMAHVMSLATGGVGVGIGISQQSPRMQAANEYYRLYAQTKKENS